MHTEEKTYRKNNIISISQNHINLYFCIVLQLSIGKPKSTIYDRERGLKHYHNLD